MRKLIYWLKENETGQSMVEYALILGIISVACILILTDLGAIIYNLFVTSGNAML